MFSLSLYLVLSFSLQYLLLSRSFWFSLSSAYWFSLSGTALFIKSLFIYKVRYYKVIHPVHSHLDLSCVYIRPVTRFQLSFVRHLCWDSLVLPVSVQSSQHHLLQRLSFLGCFVRIRVAPFLAPCSSPLTCLSASSSAPHRPADLSPPTLFFLSVMLAVLGWNDFLCLKNKPLPVPGGPAVKNLPSSTGHVVLSPVRGRRFPVPRGSQAWVPQPDSWHPQHTHQRSQRRNQLSPNAPC